MNIQERFYSILGEQYVIYMNTILILRTTKKRVVYRFVTSRLLMALQPCGPAHNSTELQCVFLLFGLAVILSPPLPHSLALPLGDARGWRTPSGAQSATPSARRCQYARAAVLFCFR